jgi:hypothetical protein
MIKELLMNNWDDDSVDIEAKEDLREDISSLSDVVIVPSDWTVETILSLVNKGMINISPEFQRREAWNNDRKSLFIETILLGLPIPQIILAEDRKERRYIVVDGRQRLLTLLQFSQSDCSTNNYTRLKLKGLDKLTKLNGLYFDDIKSNSSTEQFISDFNNFTIRCAVLKQWDTAVLYDMFLRINQNSVILSPQELRQALFPGAFTKFIEEKSASSSALREILKVEKPDPRMRDAELLLRFFTVKNRLNSTYNGNLKDLLDYTCMYFNDNWDGHIILLENQLIDFETGYEFVKDTFDDLYPFGKFEGDKQNQRFNRAIYDFIMFYFSQGNIRSNVKKIKNYKEEIQKAFRTVFKNDAVYMAVTSTTKSKDAFKIRMNAWANILSGIIGIEVESPL